MEPQTLVQRATDLAKFIQTQITARHEPCKHMQDLNLLLANEFDALWLELSAGDPRAKLDFYKVVLKGTADKLLAERMIASWNVSIGQSPPLLVPGANIAILQEHTCVLLSGGHGRGEPRRDRALPLQPGSPPLYGGVDFRFSQERSPQRRRPSVQTYPLGRLLTRFLGQP